MPFADAKYPTPTQPKRRDDWLAAHIINLKNGERLLIEERTTGLSFAVCCTDNDDPDLWACRIEPSGVLACSHSADACERLGGGHRND